MHGQGTGSTLNNLAVRATLHCLTGCAIGEIVGLVLGQALGLPSLQTFVLAIFLAFVFGYGLSLSTVIRGGLAWRKAVPLVLASDTLSIATMEITDNAVMAVAPGAMDAGLGNAIFWLAMAISLVLAFCAALPVNRYLLQRGKGHALIHQHMDHHH